MALVLSMPIAFDGLHRLSDEMAALCLPFHAAWVMFEWMALVHQGMRGSTSAALGGQEQVHITGWWSKSVAMISQQSFHETEFFVGNRHGPANAFAPQSFLVAPGFNGEDRAFQKEHVDTLVDERAPKSIGPAIGAILKFGHPPQSSVLAIFLVGSLRHAVHCAPKPADPPRNLCFRADR